MKTITAKFTFKDGSVFDCWIDFDYPTTRVPVMHRGVRTHPLRTWTESDGHIFEALARSKASELGASVLISHYGISTKWEDVGPVAENDDDFDVDPEP